MLLKASIKYFQTRLDSVLQSLEDNDPDGEPEEDEADEVANLIAGLTDSKKFLGNCYNYV